MRRPEQEIGGIEVDPDRGAADLFDHGAHGAWRLRAGLYRERRAGALTVRGDLRERVAKARPAGGGAVFRHDADMRHLETVRDVCRGLVDALAPGDMLREPLLLAKID